MKAETLRYQLRYHLALAAVALLIPAVAPGILRGQQSVVDQYGLAAGHYERGEYDQSAKRFRELIEQSPGSPQASLSHFFLGESLVQQRDYQAAFPAFQIFIKLNFDPSHLKRARFRLAECAYQLNWSTQAVTLLEDFIQRYPNDPLNDFALNFLGETRLQRAEPQLARQVFQQALKQFPKSPQSNRHRFGLAKSLLALEEKDEAIRFFAMLTVDATDPLFGLASAQMGIVDYSERRYSEAKEKLLTAVSSPISEASRIEAKYWLARTGLALGEYENAWQLFQEIHNGPINDELKAAILFDGSIAASRSGRPDVALAWLRRLQKTWPDSKWSDDALQLEIELLFQQKLYDDSIQKIAEFKDRFGDNANLPIVCDYEGRIHYHLGQFDQAVETFQSLLERFGKEAEQVDQVDQWRYFLGLAYLAQQEYELANAQFVKIRIQDNDASLSSSVLLAEASAAIGMARPDRAIDYLERYLEMNTSGSGADQARSDLVVSFAQTGNWKRANEILLDLGNSHNDQSTYLDSILWLAEYALVDRQYDFAETCFQRVTNTAYPRKYVVRGLSGMAWARMSRGDEASSVEVFEQLIAEFPETTFAAESALACGRYLEQNGQLPEAIELYELIQSRFADSKWVQASKLRQAYALHQTGEIEHLDLAEQILRDFRKTETENVDESLYQLAWICLDTQRRDEAMTLFAEISVKHSDSRYWTDATYRVAQDAVNSGNGELAVELINSLQTHELDARIETQTTFLQSQIAVQNQQWALVQQLADTLLAKTDDESLRKKARYWLAESMFQQSDYKLALAELQRLIEEPSLISNERLAWVQLRRAQCLGYQDDWSEALVHAQAAKKQFPDFEASHEFDFIVGRAHAAQGRLTDARTAFQKVVDSPTGKTTQTAAMAQWRIGETWFHQEDYEHAIEAYFRVDSLYSYEKWQAASLVEAGKCQEHLGNWKQAAKLYQQLLDRFPASEYCLAAQQRLSLATRQSKLIETTTK